MCTVEIAHVWEQMTLNTLTVRFAKKGLSSRVQPLQSLLSRTSYKVQENCQPVTSDTLTLQVSTL